MDLTRGNICLNRFCHTVKPESLQFFHTVESILYNYIRRYCCFHFRLTFAVESVIKCCPETFPQTRGYPLMRVFCRTRNNSGVVISIIKYLLFRRACVDCEPYSESRLVFRHNRRLQRRYKSLSGTFCP